MMVKLFKFREINKYLVDSSCKEHHLLCLT